jgi:hypothetical protein
MKIVIILLLIIIGACLAKSVLDINMEAFEYGRGEDYYPNNFVSNECPCLSCINQPCASPYHS